MAASLISRKISGYLCLLCIIGFQAAYMQGEVKKSVFGTMPDGTNVDIYTLQEGVLKARVITYGAHLVSLETPDRDGKIADIVLGYDSLTPYTESNPYFGAIVGRYGNRIAHGTFRVDGKQYNLPKNNGENSLHGGTQGFDKRIWSAQVILHGVELTLISKNGDQGYPGTLTARVRYTLTSNALEIEYFATTDADTVLNLTNHSYFNLAGEGQGNILNHLVTIHADRYTPVDAGQIPTGELAPVAGTPFDFRQATAVGKRIGEDNQQLHFGKGYDENYVLNGDSHGEVLKEAARVLEPKSGRLLIVMTTQPGVQFYSGNNLKAVHGKHGHVYDQFAGLCLETQHFPDSPNQPKFPSTELKPGQTFHSVTQFIFTTSK
jgi:aldose 1-epimerase